MVKIEDISSSIKLYNYVGFLKPFMNMNHNDDIHQQHYLQSVQIQQNSFRFLVLIQIETDTNGILIYLKLSQKLGTIQKIAQKFLEHNFFNFILRNLEQYFCAFLKQKKKLCSIYYLKKISFFSYVYSGLKLYQENLWRKSMSNN